MPELGEILEQPPGQARLDGSGFSHSRVFSVIADSEFSALELLKVRRDVTRGSRYKTPQGKVIPTVICQNLTVEGRPHAPIGGVGQYIVLAEYVEAAGGVNMGGQQAKPGMPVVWSVRASLTSGPVDLDIFGHEILTSSNEPLDPPLTALQPNEILHGEFYVEAPSALAAYIPFRYFIGSMNRLPLPKLGIKVPFCLLCHPFQPEPSDTGWIKMTCDFEYRPPKVVDGTEYGGWLDVWRDRGTRKIVDRNNPDLTKKYAFLVDSTLARISSPLPFNGKGQPTTDNWEKMQAPKGKPIITYNYHGTDFSKIPFPTGSI